MIISHKYKFIFIKTAKTAGTSIEIGLSKYLGSDDIITPLNPEDEAIRTSLGYQGAQNYIIPFSSYKIQDMASLVIHRKRRTFNNHASAAKIQRFVDAEIWKSYYKFCFERNPWDKAVSRYYWRHRSGTKLTLAEFVQSGDLRNVRGFGHYTEDSKVIVDCVYRYEELTGALVDIEKKVGLPGSIELPNAKGNYRKEKKHYRDLLGPQERATIAKLYAHEIAHFGYEW